MYGDDNTTNQEIPIVIGGGSLHPSDRDYPKNRAIPKDESVIPHEGETARIVYNDPRLEDLKSAADDIKTQLNEQQETLDALSVDPTPGGSWTDYRETESYKSLVKFLSLYYLSPVLADAVIFIAFVKGWKGGRDV